MFEIKYVGDNTDWVTVNLWVQVIILGAFVNEKNNKPPEFRNCPHKKKSQQKEKEEIKCGISELQEQKEEMRSSQQKKCWLLKLMESLSI